MNLFWVDLEPKRAVQLLVDAHVQSTEREAGQMLGTALRLCAGMETAAELHCWDGKQHMVERPLKEELKEGVQLIARMTHEKHPVTRWVMHHRDAMFSCLDWQRQAGLEHLYRWGIKPVALNRVPLFNELLWEYESKMPCNTFILPPICVPESCNTGHLVESYKCYYRCHKRHLLRYTGRAVPRWMRE